MSNLLPPPLTRIALQGTVGIAYAVRSYQIRGTQYADVVYPGIGFWNECPVIGDHNKAIKAPNEVFNGQLDEAKHPQVVIAFREAKRPPLILDLVSNPDIKLQDTTDEDEYHAGDQKDPDGTTQTSDTVFSNGGSTLSITQTGTIEVAPNKQMTLALNEGPLRISKGGESGDHITGAASVTEKLNEMIAAQNATTLRMKVIEEGFTAGFAAVLNAISFLLPPGVNPMRLSDLALQQIQDGVDSITPEGSPQVPLTREPGEVGFPTTLMELLGLVEGADLALKMVGQASEEDMSAPGITIPSKGA